jgi:predicted nucleic acid-binding protein
MTNVHPVVIDAGPLIHLDELNCLDLLDSFDEILIPTAVWEETLHHRPKISLTERKTVDIRSDTYPASAGLSMMISSFGLGSGEIAALTLAEACSFSVFLTDDAAARVAGESMGLHVHGTIGIIVRAIRTGKRTKDQVLQLLKELPGRSSLHISRSLLDEVITMVSSH